jgi:hypothetical protein
MRSVVDTVDGRLWEPIHGNEPRGEVCLLLIRGLGLCRCCPPLSVLQIFSYYRRDFHLRIDGQNESDGKRGDRIGTILSLVKPAAR